MTWNEVMRQPRKGPLVCTVFSKKPNSLKKTRNIEKFQFPPIFSILFPRKSPKGGYFYTILRLVRQNIVKNILFHIVGMMRYRNIE